MLYQDHFELVFLGNTINSMSILNSSDLYNNVALASCNLFKIINVNKRDQTKTVKYYYCPFQDIILRLGKHV